MSARPNKPMTRADAKALDLVSGIALLAVAIVIVLRSISEAEPLVATAFGLFRAAEG
jgi:hypothetical protein